MRKANLSRITKNGKSLMLAYDHGLEHGPKDFNGNNINPGYILNIAKSGGYNGVILQKGVAEKYYTNEYRKVPLVLKLNGKTNICKGEPISRQICSVKEAVSIGASAVGYTIYIGSAFESEMFSEFGKIEEEAHSRGLPVIMWAYPRGRAVKRLTHETLIYAARVGLELGADFVKIKYTGSTNSFKKAVEVAGRCGVLCLGGSKLDEKKFLQQARDAMSAGAAGMVIGRNVWQSSNPMKVTEKLKKIIFRKDVK